MLENLEMNKLKAVTLVSMLALSSGANALPVQVAAGSIFSELGSYAALAGDMIGGFGSVPNIISGNVGVYPGTGVIGSISYTSGGPAVSGEAGAVTAEKNALGAELAAGSATSLIIPASLGGMTLAPGNYRSHSFEIIFGILTLDGGGDPNAEWIFSSATTLVTSAVSKVQLVNTGTSEGVSVFWSVGTSATLGANSDFLGNIFAEAAITLGTSANISCGRAFAGTVIAMESSNAISRDCLGMDNQGLQYSAGLSGGTNGRLPSSSDPIFVSEVPIPAAAYLLGSALLGLGAMKRRKA
jgi:hypothetical protein